MVKEAKTTLTGSPAVAKAAMACRIQAAEMSATTLNAIVVLAIKSITQAAKMRAKSRADWRIPNSIDQWIVVRYLLGCSLMRGSKKGSLETLVVEERAQTLNSHYR